MPHVHPKDPDTLIVTDIVSFKSTDGGRTFVPFKGAPGGDDNQNIWWNPDNPDIMLLVADQGAVVTLNGGQTWSSWYTQSDGRAVSRDDRQRVSRTASAAGSRTADRSCVASRGNDGQITFRDWHPVGVEEYGYAAPDPLDPDLIYGGKVTRYDRRTGQVSDVGPVAGRGRGPPRGGRRTAPCARSRWSSRPVDPRTLFYGNNVLWKTIDGGINWTQISPDLTRETWERAEERRHVRAARAGTRARRDRRAGHLHDRAVVPRHQPHLDRHRRRRDSRRRPTAACTGPT